MKQLMIGAMVVVAGVAVADVVTSTVESSETLGIAKVSKSNLVNGECTVGIPFVKNAAGDSHTVDTVLATGVGNNDQIMVWDSSSDIYTGNYLAWAWDDEDGWDISAGSTAASEYVLNPGSTFWYTTPTTDSSVNLAVVGIVPETISYTAAAGTKSSPKMTLCMNPYGTSFNALSVITSGMASGDQILIVDDTTRYEYKKTSKIDAWRVRVPGEVIDGVKQMDTFEEYDEITVPAGKAFWYISKGGAPTIDWNALAETK